MSKAEIRYDIQGYCGACKHLIPCFDGGGPYDCTRCGAHNSAWQTDGGTGSAWFWYVYTGLGVMPGGPHGPFPTRAAAERDLALANGVAIDDWDTIRAAIAFMQSECSLPEEAEHALERARLAFESLSDKLQ